MRKIVQIAAKSGDQAEGDKIYALCDDGSLWRKNDYPDGGEWCAVEPIPQPDDKLP